MLRWFYRHTATFPKTTLRCFLSSSSFLTSSVSPDTDAGRGNERCRFDSITRIRKRHSPLTIIIPIAAAATAAAIINTVSGASHAVLLRMRWSSFESYDWCYLLFPCCNRLKSNTKKLKISSTWRDLPRGWMRAPILLKSSPNLIQRKSAKVFTELDSQSTAMGLAATS